MRGYAEHTRPDAHAPRTTRARPRVPFAFLLPVIVAVGSLAALAPNALSGFSSTPAPSLELVALHTTSGGHIDVGILAHHTASVGGFEAALRYDRGTADLGGMTVADQSLAGRARRLVALGTVDTPSGIDIGAWSCGPVPGCPQARSGVVGDTALLATIELAPSRNGRFQITLDDVVVADPDGRRISLPDATRTLTVQVGKDRTLLGAPAAAPLGPRQPTDPAPGSNDRSVDLNGDHQVSTTDVAAVAGAWTIALDSGAPCGPNIDPTADINGDGCIDIADVQLVSAGIHDGIRPIATVTTTYVVNSTSDAPDAGVNGICQTAVVGECTLRAAITEGDARSGPVVIDFNIPGTGVHTIAPATNYQILLNPFGFTIDGYSQPGASPNTDPAAFNGQIKIDLQGQGPTGVNALFLGSANNVVRGLAIHGFQRAIWMNGTGSTNNLVVGNILGLLPSGAFDPLATYQPGASCVVIQGGAKNNVVGQPGAATRNVVSGCSHQGVATYDSGTANNTIQNNIIGLAPDGVSRRLNKSHGVDINTFTTNTMIGGPNPGEGNVLSGNGQEGVEISHGTGTINNKIIGNLIGTDVFGHVSPATADGQWGVHLEGEAVCNGVCVPDEGFETVSGNTIVQAQKGGVLVDKGVHDSTIDHNRIGVLGDGTPAGNVFFGVRIESGSTHITLGPGNEIAWNANGVQLQAIGTEPANSTPSPTNYDTITQNSIHDNYGGWNLGIDLAPYGTPNVGGVGDPNVNERVDAPTLSGATATTINASTCASCTVELFQADRGAGLYGSGRVYLGTAIADGAGKAQLSVPASVQGGVVTATATTPLGSTSEFARNVSIPLQLGLAITTPSLPNGELGVGYSTTVSATGGPAPYTWSASGLPPNLSIDPNTGVISGLPTTAGTFGVTVSVTDSASPPGSAQRTYTLTIAGRVGIVTTALPDGQQGTLYSSTVTATGGVTPYAWSALGLPGGLSINASTGVISGTPTAAGTSSVTLTVTDFLGATAQTTLPLVVSPAPFGITGPSSLGVSGAWTQGRPFSASMTATGGVSPYAWSATGLPAGLSINAGTGLISGTPNVAGTLPQTFSVVVSASDASTPTLHTTRSYTLVVNRVPQITTTSCTARRNHLISFTLQASGGTPPLGWSAANMPSWLSLNAATGVLSGKAPGSSGTFVFTIQVTDAAGASATTSFTIFVTRSGGTC